MAPSTSTTSTKHRDAVDVVIEAACDTRAYSGNPRKLAVPIGGMLISLSILLYQPFINYCLQVTRGNLPGRPGQLIKSQRSRVPTYGNEETKWKSLYTQPQLPIWEVS